MKPSDDHSGLGTSFEAVPADEADEIEKISAIGVQLQDKRAAQDPSQQGKILRGVHAKSHGCVKAEFTIGRDIDEQYRIGLFANLGKTHEAWVRFSNASVLREDDLKANDEGQRQNGSRGMAIKVMNVDGEMLSQDDGGNNQDFLMINTPMFAFANVRDYLRLERVLDRDPLGADPKAYFIPAVLASLGEPQAGEDAQITGKRQFLKDLVTRDPLLNTLTTKDLMGTIASAKVAAAIAQKTVRNPMQVQYFGAAPFLFGPGRVMKFSAVPGRTVEQPPFDDVTPDNPPVNYLRDALGATMCGGDVVDYDFMIQTRKAGADGLNIEDATTTWANELAEYTPVAKLTIHTPQTPHGDAELDHCEKLAFNPWHSLAAHRPLGGINRLRRKVYSDSARHRDADGY
ncbi:MAG: hypothetical protein ABJN26_13395 [Stappiaceae bacterium]